MTDPNTSHGTTASDGAAPTETAYRRVGGEPAVTALVDGFYRRVLGDPALAPYFETVDIGRLKAHQRAMIGQVLSGPNGYQGRAMAAAHQGLGITDAHYDLVVGHLVAECGELGVPDDIVAAVGEVLDGVRGEIVNR